MSWTPSSWRVFPIKQQPIYQDQNALKKAEDTLSSYPPLIFAGEARTLKENLAKAGRGEAFLLQGGDCAESFSDFNSLTIKNLFKLIIARDIGCFYNLGAIILDLLRIAQHSA